RKNTLIAAFTLIVILSHGYGYFDKVDTLRTDINRLEQTMVLLYEKTKNETQPIIVLLSPEVTNIPSWIYFVKHKTFGFDTQYSYYPIYYVQSRKTPFDNFTQTIEYTVSGDTVSFTSKDALISIARKNSTDSLVIKETKVFRENLSSLVLRITPEQRLNASLFFFDGSAWRQIFSAGE
ncbi:MAG: hypothetical protein M0R68_14790, partial [Bacteroidetes bacterium]|nr:hypothetical protein [Bacteroidota bacterium]